MPDYRNSPLRDQLSALLSEGERTLAGRHDRAHAGIGAGDRTDPGFRVELPRAATGAADEEDGASADAVTEQGDEVTKLYIYSEIGGWFGVWPEEIVAALAEIKGDVELHLHSPGGDAFDGVAIYNALREHDGKVHGVVDGLAASAASVIAMAADDLEMKNGSQLMIHDAWGLAMGPEEDMAKMAKFLGKVSDATAEIYAAKAGGTPEEWRKAMKAESWYTGREAVEAGLADTVETQKAAAKSQWNLKIFQHAGRSDAPDPLFPGGRWDVGTWGSKMARDPQAAGVALAAPAEPLPGEKRSLVDMEALERYAAEEAAQRAPGGMVSAGQAATRLYQASVRAKVRQAAKTPAAASADGPSQTEGATGMPDRDKIREALGLGPDATDAQMQTAWAAAFAAPTPAPTPAAAPAPAEVPQGDLSALAEQAKRLGVMLVDATQVEQMRQMADLGRQAHEKLRRDERDQVIEKAMSEGRIEPSRREHWQKAWDADPEGARKMIEGLSPNLVPMAAEGYAGTVASNEADQRLFDLYPEMKAPGGRRG